MCVCVCVCVCARMYRGVFGDTHTHFISGKWGIFWEWGYPQFRKSLVIQSIYRGSTHGIGCPLRVLEHSILSPEPGEKSDCCFFVFFSLYTYVHCKVDGDNHMNTHRKVG